MDKKRILIVDDEPNVRAAVTRMLGDEYTILEAADGQGAVSIARGQRPDLIFMDIMMPEPNGYASCILIKQDEATKGIPVVMLTAIGHNPHREFAEAMGADGYITKPFTREILLEMLKRLLEPDPPTERQNVGAQPPLRQGRPTG